MPDVAHTDHSRGARGLLFTNASMTPSQSRRSFCSANTYRRRQSNRLKMTNNDITATPRVRHAACRRPPSPWRCRSQVRSRSSFVSPQLATSATMDAFHRAARCSQRACYIVGKKPPGRGPPVATTARIVRALACGLTQVVGKVLAPAMTLKRMYRLGAENHQRREPVFGSNLKLAITTTNNGNRTLAGERRKKLGERLPPAPRPRAAGRSTRPPAPR